MSDLNYVLWCHSCHIFRADTYDSVAAARAAAKQHRGEHAPYMLHDVQILKEVKG